MLAVPTREPVTDFKSACWIQGLLPAEGYRLDHPGAGGDKSSQAKDIDEALLLAANRSEESR